MTNEPESASSPQTTTDDPLAKAIRLVFWAMSAGIVWVFFPTDIFYFLTGRGDSTTMLVVNIIPKLFALSIAIIFLTQFNKLFAVFMMDRARFSELRNPFQTISRGAKSILESKDQSTKVNDNSQVRTVVSENSLFAALRERLLSESQRLHSISLRNLMIGVIFSLIALSFIAYPVIADTATLEQSAISNFDWKVWLVRHYLPRLGVGLILQFVGFFFLRLYVANELDVKQNKNELTNIEAKMLAFMMSNKSSKNNFTKIVVKSLAKTERNFTIKKGERTISVENDPQFNDLNALLQKLAEKIPSTKSPK